MCRHGQTENNKNKRLSGWIDTPLTKEGVRNATSSAEKLSKVQLDKIMSSDLGRAFATAYIISRKLGYKSEIELHKQFREMNYGDLANMPYESFPTLTTDQNTNYTPPHGESLIQMQQRVIAGIDSVAVSNSGKTILIVAHDGTINAVRASFTGEDMGVADLTRNSHDLVAKFVYDNGQIVAFNEIA